MPAIVVQDLSKRFGSTTALDRVSFEVEQGTVFGLLGPNGAGKTTAIRILTTLSLPDGGLAMVLGVDVVHHPAAVRRMIGLAGQFAAVDVNLTGRENLRLMGRLAQLPRRVFCRRADELLERFELTAAAGRPVRTYSGGMRRRLDVAAALVAQPPVLFFDEPTTGLDLHSRGELWELMRELVGEGTTVVLTTQYLEEADRLADVVAVIDKGRMVAIDSPAALKAKLGGTVIELGWKDNGRARRAASVLAPRFGENLTVTDSVVQITAAEPSQALIQALHELDSAQSAPTTLQVREPTLDDVFLSMTGPRSHRIADHPTALDGANAP